MSYRVRSKIVKKCMKPQSRKRSTSLRSSAGRDHKDLLSCGFLDKYYKGITCSSGKNSCPGSVANGFLNGRTTANRSLERKKRNWPERQDSVKL